ncbi:MAG: putative glycosyl transferase, family 2 [Mucilaginibacter sp.]|nr:putative glycosyl transferase, family 2 [Mucilaginibacter sp.]
MAHSSVLPFISVIIPSYNHEAYLPQRIESVLNQTWQDFELILLDDCSTDDSRSIIEQYRNHPKVSHIIYNEQNSGSAFKQWQRGTGLAGGQYIWIAESDDYCDYSFLEKMVEVFAQAPDNTGLAYCKSMPVDHHSQVYDQSDWWMKRIDPLRWESDFVNNGKNEVAHYLAVQCTIPNASAVLFSARCFKEVAWEDLDFKVCGDWCIYVCMLQRYDIAYTALPMNYHRSHQANARSVYAQGSVPEQYRVLHFISKHFNIHKSRAFSKALDERLSLLISLVKNGGIAKKEFFHHLFMMRSFDPGYGYRLLRVLYAKVFHINLHFK